MVLAVILAFVATMILGAIMNGWALSILWAWFLVPFGAPQIGVAWAIGVSLTIGYLTYQSDAADNSDNSDDRMRMVIKLGMMAFVRPLLALFVGWIVHSFM